MCIWYMRYVYVYVYVYIYVYVYVYVFVCVCKCLRICIYSTYNIFWHARL